MHGVAGCAASRNKRRKLTPEQKRSIRDKVRISDLHKALGFYYGGGDLYALPDDDDGRHSLMILLQHYANSNPLRISTVAKARAPWISEDEADEIVRSALEHPRKWSAAALGKELNLADAVRRDLDITTIAPADRTVEERKQDRRLRKRMQKRRDRRQKNPEAVSRAEYLETHKLSRTEPWKAAGMSRAKWYRQRVPTTSGNTKVFRETSTRETSMSPTKRVLEAGDIPVSLRKHPVSERGRAKYRPVAVPAQESRRGGANGARVSHAAGDGVVSKPKPAGAGEARFKAFRELASRGMPSEPALQHWHLLGCAAAVGFAGADLADLHRKLTAHFAADDAAWVARWCRGEAA
jgi:hypothetical protein